MFDHVGVSVSDRAASRRFYDTVLAPLGHRLTHQTEHFDEWDDFGTAQADAERPVTTGLHVAFVDTREGTRRPSTRTRRDGDCRRWSMLGEVRREAPGLVVSCATFRAVEEIVPGIWHWAAPHPRIKIRVHSYYLPAERTLIDPIAPAEGLDWFAEHGPPSQVLLTNRHHYRSSGDFVERFDATVRCVRQGMHEFEGGAPVQPFDFGDELPGGVIAHQVGAICPDETALYLPAHRALAIADGAVRWEEGCPLAFVPDSLMDEPERTKRGLREAYRRLAKLDFDHLLLAHGEPFIGNGREQLGAFAA